MWKNYTQRFYFSPGSKQKTSTSPTSTTRTQKQKQNNNISKRRKSKNEGNTNMSSSIFFDEKEVTAGYWWWWSVRPIEDTDMKDGGFDLNKEINIVLTRLPVYRYGEHYGRVTPTVWFILLWKEILKCVVTWL